MLQYQAMVLTPESGEDGALLYGLTEAEAIARRMQGEGNNVHIATGRSYLDIIRQNVFTFINTILFLIGFIMILLGLYSDAVVSVGVVLSNVVVSLVQEIRAKRQLDRIALLTRPKVTLVREGVERTVDPAEIVLGDILIARSGDQAVVDGVVVGDGAMDMDESLLTGESDLISKRAGDKVFSGSFCVTGTAAYRATQVGATSFANQLTARAKVFHVVRTPLQQDINLVVRILALMASVVGILFAMSFIVHQVPMVQVVRSSAVIAGLVPAGLILITATAYAMGALRMSGKGALIQQMNAIESMSNVDVLCLDKTGTLTANRFRPHDVYPLNGESKAALRAILGDYAYNIRSGNRTSDAILEAFGGISRRVVDEIPFSSARKWSALSMNDPVRSGVYVLGAPEILAEYLPEGSDIDWTPIHDWAGQGLRVLLLAHSPEVIPLYDDDDEIVLPEDLQPVGIIGFSDELRDEAQATIVKFAEAGIALKIISGDNPQTVASLAIQAGFSPDIRVVSGAEIARMDDVQLDAIVEEATVFGRITPDQKEMLVKRLRTRGHYVAMIGDGVNDVLSLKQAQIGVAMQSGSAATRGVADIVLLNDSFAALPLAFIEGQRILNGMDDIIRLFLTRAFYAAFIILGTAVVVESKLFPFVPKHASLLTLITVGFPTFALAAWARPGVPRYNLPRSLLHFVFPAALTFAGGVLTVYAVYLWKYWYPVAGDGLAEAYGISLAQSALTTTTIFMGLVLVVFVEPPTRFWVGGDELSSDRRPAVLAVCMFVLFMLLMLTDSLREFFEFERLSLSDYLLIGGVTVFWTFLIRAIWRHNLFERLLGITYDVNGVRKG